LDARIESGGVGGLAITDGLGGAPTDRQRGHQDGGQAQ
jgi:hypothetical protein